MHSALAAAGYTLHLSRNKLGATAKAQGAVDVSVVTTMFLLGGAFARDGRGPVDHLVLMSSDSDFEPAIAAIAAGVPSLHLWVVSQRSTTSAAFLAFLRSRPEQVAVDIIVTTGRTAFAAAYLRLPPPPLSP